ncbi:caspase, EACC1-associated type [Actinoplanes sp. CA-015351]|uniref:caspase family protein n=1 Tax=Actinoplanes sp. CA-015351 TaxID=3239897 RepID=UPI003D97A69A
MTGQHQPDTWLPDPRRSRAVLVGVSDYGHLEALPAVERNLDRLAELLTTPSLWGLRADDCTLLHNPQSAEEVLDAVNTAAGQATDALVVYFAGHGLLDNRDDLHLALPLASRKRLYRAVRYDDLRREVVETARNCRSKVMLLDCCYSGRAMQGAMGAPDVAEQARIAGTYLMTATAETSKALAPPGDDYTAFTGALIDKISTGIADGAELLDLETLFYHLRADLSARRLPIPQQRSRNDGSAIALVRNVAYRPAQAGVPAGTVTTGPAPAPAPPPPRLTPELRKLMELSPSATVDRLRTLHDDGDDKAADALLAAVGVHRTNQEIAALGMLLLREGRTRDFRALARHATHRPVPELLDLLRTLDVIGAADVARGFLEAVAAGPTGETARLAGVLRDEGLGRHLETLVGAALRLSPDVAARTALVGDLWVAGLRGEVDQFVQQVATELPSGEVLALADELRTAGREDASNRLYAMAEEPDDTHQPSGHQPSGHQAEGLTDDEIAELTRALRDANHEDAALHLLAVAVGSRPASSTLRLVDSLRDMGRPVDAVELLRVAAQRMRPTELGRLLAALEAQGRLTEWSTVMSGAGQRRQGDAAAVLAALGESGAVLTLDQIGDLIGDADEAALRSIVAGLEPPWDYGALAAVLQCIIGELGFNELRSLVQSLSHRDIRKVFYQAGRVGGPTLSAVIKALPPLNEAKLFEPTPTWPLGELLTNLRRFGHNGHADYVLIEASYTTIPPEVIAIVVQDLRRRGQDRDADYLIAEVVDKKWNFGHRYGRSAQELLEFVFALRAGEQDEEVRGVVDRVPQTRNADEIDEVKDLLEKAGLNDLARRMDGRGPVRDPRSRRRT